MAPVIEVPVVAPVAQAALTFENIGAKQDYDVDTSETSSYQSSDDMDDEMASTPIPVLGDLSEIPSLTTGMEESKDGTTIITTTAAAKPKKQKKQKKPVRDDRDIEMMMMDE